MKNEETGNPAAWKIVKDLMISDPENFASYLTSRKFGTKKAKPEEEALPQPESEIDFDPSKPMVKQKDFAKNVEELKNARIAFDKGFMRVPLLYMQQEIYMTLLKALRTLFDQEASLTRTDKGEAPEQKPEEAPAAEPEVAVDTEETKVGPSESLIREEPEVVEPEPEVVEPEPEENPAPQPEEDTGVKFFDVDPKVMKNIKIDLRYIEETITNLHTLLHDFILSLRSTRQFAEEEKQEIIAYAKQLQMKIAETYHMISTIGPMKEAQGAELSREEKIDMVDSVYNNTVAQLKELDTLMRQPVKYEDVHGKANETILLLDTISAFFPRTAKFTSGAKTGSAGRHRTIQKGY